MNQYLEQVEINSLLASGAIQPIADTNPTAYALTNSGKPKAPAGDYDMCEEYQNMLQEVGNLTIFAIAAKDSTSAV